MKILEEKLDHLAAHGIVPYIATSEQYLKHLNTDIFKGREVVKLLERDEDIDFHNAYIFSNYLGFQGTDVLMPNWVYIDFIMLQTAVIGFAIERDKAPKTLVDSFDMRHDIKTENLDYLPISGQTAGAGIDKETLMGFSLFSLRRLLGDYPVSEIGLLTKIIGLYAHDAHKYKQFIGISQYDNPAIKIHARFGEKMYIQTPMVPLHPMAEQTMIYNVQVSWDEQRLFAKRTEPEDYDVLMRHDDKAFKTEMTERIKAGEKFYIAPPYQVKKEDEIFLPIHVEAK